MTLGQLIKTERNKRGWSIRDLADQIGNICRHQYLSLLEKDPVSKKSGDPIKPRREILEALAKAFRLPVHTVLHAAGYLGPVIDIDDEARELLGYFKGLDSGSPAAQRFDTLRQGPSPDLSGGYRYLQLERMAYYVNKDAYRAAVREATATLS